VSVLNIAVGSGAAVVVLGFAGRLAVSVVNWFKDLTRKTDLQNKLLFGDGSAQFPGVRQWETAHDKNVTEIKASIRNLDDGQIEILRRGDAVEQVVSAAPQPRNPTSRRGDPPAQ
jgi:hypothetical protein